MLKYSVFNAKSFETRKKVCLVKKKGTFPIFHKRIAVFKLNFQLGSPFSLNLRQDQLKKNIYLLITVMK